MEVVSIVKMILFTVAFWLFLIVIGFHTPAKRTKKITELLMGGMILFFFLFEILALCSFLSMEISYALLAGTGNLGGAVCQFDCSKLEFYYEINPV